jgi:hypothetical protein
MTATATPGMSRWRASGIHLLISAALAVVTLILLLKVWYPPPLFSAEGGNDLLFILIGVDVVIGPLITLIIFKAGKPSLRMDLTVIALLQLGALIYGGYVMFVARPVYVVLVLDAFETVRANDLDPADVAQARRPEYQSLPLTGPLMVSVDLPKDMALLRALIADSQKGGKGVQHLPKYYVPYAEARTQALGQSQPVQKLLKGDTHFSKQLEKHIAETGRKAADLNYLPLQTRRGWGAVLMDAKAGDVVKLLPPPDL